MRHNKTGFTLLELMIAIALMLIVMLMLRTMFTSAQQIYLITARRIDVYSQGRVAMDILEADLLRLSADNDSDSLVLRSLSSNNLREIDLPHTEFYSRLNDYSSPDDKETPRIKEFCSFAGIATWYDRDQKVFITGNAIVVYYLRARIESAEIGRQDGAYLVRRILPLRSLAEIAAAASPTFRGKLTPIRPYEDEIASFVHSVRVYVDDKAAFARATGATENSAGNSNSLVNIFPECQANTNKYLWVADAGGDPNTQKTKDGQTILQLARPPLKNGAIFGGILKGQIGGKDPKYLSTQGEFPTVVVFELTLVDKSFSRKDKFGTYRTLTRAVHLPSSSATRFLTKDDLALMSR